MDIISAYSQVSAIGELKQSVKGIRSVAIPNFDRLPRKKKLVPLIRWGKGNYRRKSLQRFVRKNPVDIIHFHFGFTAIKWKSLALGNDIPYTVSIRGSDFHTLPVTQPGYLERLKQALDHASQIHTVSEELRGQLIEKATIDPNRIKVIRTCVSDDWLEVDNRRSKDIFKMICVGRLHWIKGYSDLLIACSGLLKSGRQFQLKIIGEGPDRDRLKYMIRDLDLEKNVELTGKISHEDIRKLMIDCSLLIQPSLKEGFPNSIAEALVAGVPVISSDLKGIREVLENLNLSYDPFFVAGDPNSLRIKIEDFVSSDERSYDTSQHKKNARELFSSSNHSREFLGFWRGALINN